MKEAIENIFLETRTFEQPQCAKDRSRLSEDEYNRLYRESLECPTEFWDRQASKLHWFSRWNGVLVEDPPVAQWFVGGTTNLCYNAIDRHLEQHGQRRALVWEGENGEVSSLTYAELSQKVNRCAGALEALGVQPGDRVTLYMPLIPEAVIAMLACTRIGAVHSVVFAGFSAQALAERIQDAESKIVITASHGYRQGKCVPLKENVDMLISGCPSVERIVTLNRTGVPVAQTEMHIDWDECMRLGSETHSARALDSEHPLFILYTSGSTGKPKGVLHTTGGYMVGVALSMETIFDLRSDDLFWCTADIGWITGHSYSVYGPLLCGGTTFLYEGALNYPDPGRVWELIERHNVSVLYTAPTAIRAWMRSGETWMADKDLSSLRLLGSVGEPINPEAWMWYHTAVGKEKCPIVDTWWQTETGSVMVTTLPGIHTMKPGSAGVPLFGVDAAILNEQGEMAGPNEGGFLVIRRPWPSMFRTLYKDPERYKKAYWGKFQSYLTGDGASKDSQGYITIMGRVDDVINVSGHRLGTMEIESALVEHPSVAEAAVVGCPDSIKGEHIVAFVTLKVHAKATGLELRQCVTEHIGALARPEKIYICEALPKTRSGKIMRRFLKQLAQGQDISGDLSTLEDPGILVSLQQLVKTQTES